MKPIRFLLILLVTFLLLSLESTSASTQLPCHELLKSIFVKSNKFEKSGIEFEGTIDTIHYFTKEQLADKENYLSHVDEYMYDVLGDVKAQLEKIIVEEYANDDSFELLNPPDQWYLIISYMLNGHKYLWEVSRERALFPKAKNLLPIEIASPILRSEADRETFLRILTKSKKIGIKAEPNTGALQFHFDISKYSVGEVKGMLKRYTKVHDVLIKYLKGNKNRAEVMKNIISNEAILIQIDQLDNLAKKDSVLFGKIEQYQFKRGALRLASDKGTVEIRIFDSVMSPAKITKNYDLSQKLIKALLDNDSDLSNYLRETTPKKVTIKKVFELIDFTY